MLKRNLILSAILAGLAPAAFAADASPHTITSNVGLVTDYVYRGISQTSHNPAIQGGIDYSHSSGVYAGVWGSNVSWIADSGAVATGSVTMELDTYFGFKGGFATDFTYDVGFIRYNYLGDYTAAAGFADADTDEVYGAIGYKWFTAKYSYGTGQFLTVPGASGTNYIDISASYPIADTGFTVVAHAGKQTYKGSAAAAFANSPTYTDYKLGVTKDLSGYVVGLAYTKTNATAFYNYGPNFGGDWGDATTALSVTHSF